MPLVPGISPGPDGFPGLVNLWWIPMLEVGHIYPPDNYGRRFPFGPKPQRYYEFTLPPGYVPGTPLPVFIVLHGGSGFGASIRYNSQMLPAAAARNCITVYPGGTHPTFTGDNLFWMTGLAGFPLKAAAAPGFAGVDDVAFIDFIIDDLMLVATVDPTKIYIVGFSNGAMMAYRIAQALSHRIAGCAAVAGHMAVSDFPAPPTVPMPLIQFSGALDPIHLLAGGQGVEISGTPYEPYTLQSVENVIASWTAELNCFPKQTAQTKGVSHAKTFRCGNSNLCRACVSWISDDAGHSWPGGISPGTGGTSADIKATDLLLDFLLNYRRLD